MDTPKKHHQRGGTRGMRARGRSNVWINPNRGNKQNVTLVETQPAAQPFASVGLIPSQPNLIGFIDTSRVQSDALMIATSEPITPNQTKIDQQISSLYLYVS